MATCPQCYTGTCSRHKRQDHGRSQVKSADAQGTLKKIYDQLVGAKLQKLQAEAERDLSKQHSKEFRRQLDESRDKSLRKKSKTRPKLSKDVTGSGLNPQALAAVYGSDSENDSGREKDKKRKLKHKYSSRKRRRRSRSDSESESSSSDDERSHRRHKRKHSRHKKSHKKSKRSRTDSINACH